MTFCGNLLLCIGNDLQYACYGFSVSETWVSAVLAGALQMQPKVFEELEAKQSVVIHCDRAFGPYMLLIVIKRYHQSLINPDTTKL